MRHNMKKLIITQAIYSKPQATNADEMKKAWEDGKDFEIISIGEHFGRYVSIRDLSALKKDGYTAISIRMRTGQPVAVIDL